MSNLQPATNQSPNMVDLTTGMFSLIISLRDGRDFGEVDHLRQQVNNFLAGLDRAGAEAGYIRDDMEAAKFALVVFLDETILNSHWDKREIWRDNPLQLSLFGERGGGSRFFKELEKLRQQGEAKREVLEVYHICLTLGFEGQYRVSGMTHLKAILADLRNQLGYDPRDKRELKLSPHGKPRDRSVALVQDTFPFWKIAGISIGVLVVLFIVFYFIAGYSTRQAIDAISVLSI
jgi:type VI secretion system protein ImpK